MIATTTHTRRPLRLKLAQPFMIWWLRFEIASAEAYADHALAGGVLTADEIALLLANITPLRARLAMWEAA